MDKIKMVLVMHWNKRVLLCILMVLGTITSAMSQNSFTAKLYGKVLDSIALKPVQFASIVILPETGDSVIQGGLTQENGEFIIDNVPLGILRLEIGHIGFKKYTQLINVNSNNLNIDLGNIILSPTENILKEATITAEKDLIEFKYDKMVVNVEKDISARGGTGLDALKNVPGVTVDADEKISLRNGNPTIYIDGKPTSLTLDQVPADQILQIEIITTPSAKYEAAAFGGIINILLKKNNKPGYNGFVNLGAGTNSQYNGMFQFNLKEKKWGLGISYNVNGATNNIHAYNNRDNFSNGGLTSSIKQDINQVFTRSMHFGRLNFDYYIDNRNTLSFSENIMIGTMNNAEEQKINNTDYSGVVTSNSNRENLQQFSFYNFTSSLLFKHTSPKQGKEWTLDISYNYSPKTGNNNNTTTTYLPNGSIQPENPALQTMSTQGKSHLFTAQWDYTNPIGKKGYNLDFGFRVNYSRQESSQVTNQYSYSTSAYERDSSLSYNYLIDDLVSAGYITFSRNAKKFSYQVGLRFEQVYYSAEMPETNQHFSYLYPSSIGKIYQSLFPSLNLTGKIDNSNTIQVNITRKINRPNMFQNSPFIMFSDKYNYTVGNPLLTPEFINKAEITYYFSKKKFSLISSVYGNYQEQPITSYAYFLNDTSQILVNTFANAKYGISYGLDNTIKFNPIKNLDITINGNVFYTYIDKINQTTTGNEGWSWFLKGNIMYKFPWGINFQVNGAYEAPRIIPQGSTRPVYYFDVSLSKEFDWLTVNFTVSDVLNSRVFGFIYDTEAYYQDQTKRRDTRYAKLSIMIKFGKMDKSFFKKNKTEIINTIPMESF